MKAIRRREGKVRCSSSLAGELGDEGAEAGHVPARLRQARHHTHAQRLADRGHHDGDGLGCVLCRTRRRRSACDDEVASARDQLARQLWESFGISLGRMVLNHKICALDVPALAQALSKRFHVCGVLVGRNRLQHADTPNLNGLSEQRHRTRSRHRCQCNHRSTLHARLARSS